MIVQAAVTINGTTSAVWEIITNIPKAPALIRGIESVEILSTPPESLIGLRWRETRIYFGKPAAIDKWITEAVTESFYKTKAEMDGFEFITTLTISENGSSITLTSSHETKSKNFTAKLKSIPMIFFSGVVRKAILQDLLDIKAAVESK
jgi:hypothetical protein